MIHVCIFEDDTYQNLYPLTYSKPAYDLLVGTDTILNNTLRHFGYGNVSILCRPHLKTSLKKTHSDIIINTLNKGSDCLFYNGRVLLTRHLLEDLTDIDLNSNHLFTHKGNVVAAYIKRESLPLIDSLLHTPPSNEALIAQLRQSCVTRELEYVHIINYSWDILKFNSKMLYDDFKYYNKPGIIKGNVKPFAQIYNENNVFIDKNSVIEDFVLINAENGPVYIEQDVTVEAHTRLEGPLFIGRGSKILGGKISSSSIGPMCKVAGEVSLSVFQGYCNKAHGGYVGNSVLSEWVNLGAFTTTSNLKNNYSPITMELEHKRVKTQELFIGSIIGSHVKTGIGTTLNTGTIIGYGSCLFDIGFHDKYIAPFSWGSPKSYTPVELPKLLSTIRTVMKRRDIDLSKTEEELIISLYKHAIQPR